MRRTGNLLVRVSQVAAGADRSILNLESGKAWLRSKRIPARVRVWTPAVTAAIRGTEFVVYASDHEHGDTHLDASVRDHAADAKILVYDAQYTPHEYQQRVGWGHSTWLEGARVATQTGVGQLILFHHDPAHDDTMMMDIVREARHHFAKVHAASEGEFFIL